jgi:hypothetical protein
VHFVDRRPFLLKTLAWIVFALSGVVLIGELQMLFGFVILDPVPWTLSVFLVLTPVSFGASAWYLLRLWKISKTVIYPYDDNEYGERWTPKPNDSK